MDLVEAGDFGCSADHLPTYNPEGGLAVGDLFYYQPSRMVGIVMSVGTLPGNRWVIHTNLLGFGQRSLRVLAEPVEHEKLRSVSR